MERDLAALKRAAALAIDRLGISRISRSRERTFAFLVTCLGIAFLPRILPDLVWAIDGTDAIDFEIFAGASRLAWAGQSPYDVVSCGSCAYRYSPLFAYLFAPLAWLGSTAWVVLHFAALLALPLRIAKFFPFLWPFWWDVGVGSNLIFIVVFSYHALQGRKWAIVATYATFLLAPRPLLMPVVGWLLWRFRQTRVPFVLAAVVSMLGAVATGYLVEWYEILLASTSEMYMMWNVAPSAFIGGLWPFVGLPLAALLTYRGHVGLASLAASPYWIPYYLEMAALPRAGRPVSRAAERLVWDEFAKLVGDSRFAREAAQIRSRFLHAPRLLAARPPAKRTLPVATDAERERAAGHE